MAASTSGLFEKEGSLPSSGSSSRVFSILESSPASFASNANFLALTILLFPGGGIRRRRRMSERRKTQTLENSCIAGLFFMQFFKQWECFHVEAQLGEFNSSFPSALVAIVVLSLDRRGRDNHRDHDEREATPPIL